MKLKFMFVLLLVTFTFDGKSFDFKKLAIRLSVRIRFLKVLRVFLDNGLFYIYVSNL